LPSGTKPIGSGSGASSGSPFAKPGDSPRPATPGSSGPSSSPFGSKPGDSPKPAGSGTSSPFGSGGARPATGPIGGGSKPDDSSSSPKLGAPAKPDDKTSTGTAPKSGGLFGGGGAKKEDDKKDDKPAGGGAPKLGGLFGGAKKEDDKKDDKPAGGGAPKLGGLFGGGAKKEDDKKDDKPAGGGAPKLGGLFGGGGAKKEDDKKDDKPAGGGAPKLGGLFGGGGAKKEDDKAGNKPATPASAAPASPKLGGAAPAAKPDPKKDEKSAGGGSPFGRIGGLFGGAKKEDDKGGDKPATPKLGAPAAGAKPDDKKGGDKAAVSTGSRNPLGSVGARLGSIFSRGGGGEEKKALKAPQVAADPKKNTGALSKPGAAPPARLDKPARPLERASSGVEVKNRGLSLDQKLDLIGYTLLVAAFITFGGLVQPTEGSVTSGVANLLGQLFGWGRYLWPAISLFVGGWLLIRKFKENPLLEIDFLRLVGFAILYVTVVTILHFYEVVQRIVPDLNARLALSNEIALQMMGGGAVGHNAYQLLISFAGEWGVPVVLVGLLLLGNMLTFEITFSEIALYVQSIFRLFTRMFRGYSDSARIAREERAKRKAERMAERQVKLEAQRARLAAQQVSVEKPAAAATPAAAALIPAAEMKSLPEPPKLRGKAATATNAATPVATPLPLGSPDAEATPSIPKLTTPKPLGKGPGAEPAAPALRSAPAAMATTIATTATAKPADEPIKASVAPAVPKLSTPPPPLGRAGVATAEAVAEVEAPPTELPEVADSAANATRPMETTKPMPAVGTPADGTKDNRKTGIFGRFGGGKPEEKPASTPLPPAENAASTPASPFKAVDKPQTKPESKPGIFGGLNPFKGGQKSDEKKPDSTPLPAAPAAAPAVTPAAATPATNGGAVKTEVTAVPAAPAPVASNAAPPASPPAAPAADVPAKPSPFGSKPSAPSSPLPPAASKPNPLAKAEPVKSEEKPPASLPVNAGDDAEKTQLAEVTSSLSPAAPADAAKPAISTSSPFGSPPSPLKADAPASSSIFGKKPDAAKSAPDEDDADETPEKLEPAKPKGITGTLPVTPASKPSPFGAAPAKSDSNPVSGSSLFGKKPDAAKPAPDEDDELKDDADETPEKLEPAKPKGITGTLPVTPASKPSPFGAAPAKSDASPVSGSSLFGKKPDTAKPAPDEDDELEDDADETPEKLEPAKPKGITGTLPAVSTPAASTARPAPKPGSSLFGKKPENLKDDDDEADDGSVKYEPVEDADAAPATLATSSIFAKKPDVLPAKADVKSDTKAEDTDDEEEQDEAPASTDSAPVKPSAFGAKPPLGATTTPAAPPPAASSPFGARPTTSPFKPASATPAASPFGAAKPPGGQPLGTLDKQAEKPAEKPIEKADTDEEPKEKVTAPVTAEKPRDDAKDDLAERDHDKRPAASTVKPATPAEEPLTEGALTVAAFSRGTSGWTMPNFQNLLEKGSGQRVQDEVIQQRARLIEETLDAFGAPGKVIEIHAGPVITQFGVEPGYLNSRGKQTRVKVSAIAKLDADLALALAAKSIRIEAPVPGKGYVGIEVPNAQTSVVGLRDLMEAPSFQKINSRLRIALGKSVDGAPIVADLTTMPHMLIAGTTGSGKSVCVNAIIACLLLNNSPDDLKFVMVDPKRVELTGYNGIPHLVSNVVVDLERIVGVLKWVTREMDERYKKFSAASARNIIDYNSRIGPMDPKLPYLVVVIDELADLMMLAPEETEKVLTRLAQMARATGIHLILSTQRPSVDVVTGLIKANFPARISFAVASSVDSRVILDQPGAEKLLGRGDMLYQAPDAPAPLRVQGVYVSDAEINRLTQHWKVAKFEPGDGKSTPALTAVNFNTSEKSAEPVQSRRDAFGGPRPSGGGTTPQAGKNAWEPSKDPARTVYTSMSQREAANGDDDDMYNEAVDLFKKMGKVSVSLLQRRLRVGYTRAERLIKLMKQRGVITDADTVAGDVE
jgi:DNA segregation ATPase FtsK/SpoIIIE-like protein